MLLTGKVLSFEKVLYLFCHNAKILSLELPRAFVIPTSSATNFKTEIAL